MFCPVCRSVFEGETHNCQPSAPQGNTIVLKPKSARIQEQKNFAGTRDPKLTGVRGCLLFYVFILFLGSVASIFMTLVNFSTIGIIDLAWSGYGFYTAYLLSIREPAGVKHTKIFLSISIGFGVLMLLVSSTAVSETASKSQLEGLPLIVSSMLWLWYFLISKRVRNTYGV